MGEEAKATGGQDYAKLSAMSTL